MPSIALGAVRLGVLPNTGGGMTQTVTAPPINLSLPVIFGTVALGQQLTAGNGIWSQSPTGFTFQWYRGGAPIAGATSRLYTPVQADVGQMLDVAVTATNAIDSTVIASLVTNPVVASLGFASTDLSDPDRGVNPLI